MSGIRGRACRATGTAAWPRRTSSFSTSTAQPRKPHKTVPSKHAGETLGGGGLRGADGTVHAKTGTGNAIQSHRIPDSVFRIMRHKGGLGAAGSHPAVFPVALVEAVLDGVFRSRRPDLRALLRLRHPAVAAERAGRRCFAMELDPVYCDVAVRRWEMATGTMSFVESVANVVVGYGIAVAAQMLLFPVFGMHMTLTQNLKLAGAFTIISICRSFALRRIFEAIRVRGYK
jgi:hypothetical protein